MATKQKVFAAGDWQSSVAASDAIDVSELKNIQVLALKAGGTLTLDVQVSFDGTNWADWEADQNGPLTNAIPSAKMVRINTSAWTSGTPVAALSGEVA
jgi:hypothetical protein